MISIMTSNQTWLRLKKIPMRYPLAFGMVISTFKTSLSDILVQKVIEKREKIDWTRNLAFAGFGCFYLGGVQYALYVGAFTRMFPNAGSFAAKSVRDKLKDGPGMLNLGKQVIIDQFIHHPLLYFPVFYCIKEFAMSDKPEIFNALNLYKENMSDDLTALWKIWLPSTIINFAFMPIWARIPWVAGTSFIWTCVLSTMRGGHISDSVELAGGAVTGAALRAVSESLHDLFTCPVDVDPKLAHVCITAAGPDKIGWVAMISREVANNGGNITHSKMIRMGQEFTVMMQVAVKPEKRRSLISSLLSNEELEPLNLRATSLRRRETGKYAPSIHGFKIHCVGEDRPGMLAAITEELGRLEWSVEKCTTELRLAKSGKREFSVFAKCVTANTLDRESVDRAISDLMKLKKSLKLDIMDIQIVE